MLLTIADVLSAAQVQQARRLLDAASWVDGNVTSGHQSAKAKHNEQVPEDHPAAREVGAMILQALNAHALFFSAALPKHVFPPLFNRYGVGQGFRTHVDNAIRRHRASGTQLRTDLSATLFLSEPGDYGGGELVIDDTYGAQRIKLPAGHLLLYPATSLHQVTPITRGARLASFFWIQSLVRDDGERRLLFDLDNAIRALGADHPEHASGISLTGTYHNLLRRWADV